MFPGEQHSPYWLEYTGYTNITTQGITSHTFTGLCSLSGHKHATLKFGWFWHKQSTPPCFHIFCCSTWSKLSFSFNLSQPNRKFGPKQIYYKCWFQKTKPIQPQLIKTRSKTQENLLKSTPVPTRTDRYKKSPIPYLTELLNVHYSNRKWKYASYIYIHVRSGL